MMTGAPKNRASSTSAGPRNRAKLIRCRRSWARAKSGMANSWPGPETGRDLSEPLPDPRAYDVLVLDDHVLAELVGKLVDDEIRRRLCGEPAGFDPLDALEDDRVVLADLRVVRHEARVFQHRRRGHQCTSFIHVFRHRLSAVVDRRVVRRHRMAHVGNP